jgi:hypothetical protein
LLSACNSSNPPVPPDPSTFSVYGSGADIGISAPAGSADPGTPVNITAGGEGSWTANADGSVSFKATASAGNITLSYTKSDQSVISDATVQALSSRVTTPLFPTGSAPNDMLLFDGSLFIANSLDNTVIRYGLDGAVQATATFPQFASPSYLGTDGIGIFVVRNGDNIVSGHFADTLALSPPYEFPLTDPSAAFIGPGSPVVTDRFVYVPRTQIETFGPTTYSPGVVTAIDFIGGTQADFGTTGLSTGSAFQRVIADQPDQLWVVSAGDVQFDDDFIPFVVTDSILDIYQINESDGSLSLESSHSLGKIGANGITMSGSTAFLGNVLNGTLYKVELSAESLVTPIQLTSEHTYISDVELVPGTDLLLATSFNTDELYVIDTVTNTVSPAPYPGPFDLSLDPQLLGGALGVEVDNSVSPAVAYVLYSVANIVAKVSLLP